MMRLLNIGIVLTICISIQSCAPSNEFKATKYNVENSDFSYLKDVLEGKRIVALGESSHGYGNLQSYKGEMVKYLHEELGYDVLIMETSYGDAKLSWENINHAESGNQIRDNSLFQNFRSEEMTPLFDYIVEKRESEDSLVFSGYDSQIASDAFKFILKHVVNRIEIKIIQDSIQTGFDSFHAMFQMKDNQKAWQLHKNKLLAGINLAMSVIEDNKDEILEKKIATRKEVDIINHTLACLKESVNYDFGETYTEGLAKRDSLMAMNIISQVDGEYKDKKVILWGHNGHIEKTAAEGDNIKWMGHFLSEKYKDEYYALGIFCKKGNIYSFWNKTNKPFDILEKGYIEKTLNDEYQGGVFVNLPEYSENKEWYNNQIYGYEPEAGGRISFVPTKRFDGVLLFPETDAPTFIVKGRR